MFGPFSVFGTEKRPGTKRFGPFCRFCAPSHALTDVFDFRSVLRFLPSKTQLGRAVSAPEISTLRVTDLYSTLDNGLPWPTRH